MFLLSPIMNGLILAGGASSRMGSNKALLQYGSLPQYKVVHQLLNTYCKQVFINSNSNDEFDVPVLRDNIDWVNIGPMAAVLSAFNQEHCDWLFLGVDYPLIAQQHLAVLFNEFTKYHRTCAYYHEKASKYEPFIAIIKADDVKYLYELVGEDDYSLQSFYNKVNATKVLADHPKYITSINTLADYNKIKHENF